jgi:two-component system cell cycle sensor histidine kinase/response regulator CckA
MPNPVKKEKMVTFEIEDPEVSVAAEPNPFRDDYPVSLAEIHLINSLIGEDLDNVGLYNSLSGILHKIGSVVEFESAALFLRDQGALTMTCKASCGMSLRQVRAAEQEINQIATESFLQRQSPVFVRPPESSRRTPREGSALVAPIRYNGTFRGALKLTPPSQRAYGQKEVHLISLVSHQLAMLFENQSLRKTGATGPDRYKSLLDKANIPLFSISDQGAFLHANHALLELLGYSDESELRAVNFFNQILNPKSTGARLKRVFLRSEYINDFETRMNRKDGSKISVLICSRPIRGACGQITGHEGILLDQTVKKLAAEEIFRDQKMASLGQLTSGVAHDFNNLIAGIMGCASMVLLETDPKSPQYEDIQTILTTARKAGDLSAQLLAYGGKETPPSRPLSMNTLISEVLNMLSRTFDGELVIRRTLFPRLSTVEGDATRLQQALMNICLNARDAMPEGGLLTVETENVCLEEKTAAERFHVKAGPYVLVRIRDTGCGMDGKTIQKIFEPFFTTKETNRGSGLGLFIAHEIARKHNGGISVSSTLGEGTTFEIVFPVCGGQLQTTAEIGRPADLPRGTETLLFVDDEEVVRRVGKRMLERFGYRVLMAKNGPDALRTVKKANGSIDLLILDKTMANMDGLETMRKIKQIKPQVRALLTSGYTGTELQDELSRLGFCGFIPKPFLASQMLKLIRQSLDGARVVFQ